MVNKHSRIGEERFNNQGCSMKIIKYNNARNVIIEFQDKYKTKIQVEYGNYKKGNVKNPYYPSVYGVGIIGNKYHNVNIDCPKEYKVWCSILQRCFDKQYKERLIKQVAQTEYDKNNITEQCYKAMLNYKVEITD